MGCKTPAPAMFDNSFFYLCLNTLAFTDLFFTKIATFCEKEVGDEKTATCMIFTQCYINDDTPVNSYLKLLFTYFP